MTYSLPKEKNPKKTLEDTIQKKTIENEYIYFYFSIPNNKTPIFKGKIKIGKKTIEYGIRDEVKTSDSIQIFSRKKGEKEWKLGYSSN